MPPPTIGCMKHLFQTLFGALVYLSFSHSGWAQDSLKKPYILPISVSVFNEGTALPFTQFLTLPIHPGIQVGTEFTYHHKGVNRIYQTVNGAYFYHNYMAQGYYLNTEIAYEFRTKFGLAFGALFGVGFLHTFSTQAEYALTDGEYIRKRDKGNPRLMPSLALDLGYYIKSKTTPGTKIFLRYQGWAEYPFSPGFIPIMTHINLHLGVKFHITVPRK